MRHVLAVRLDNDGDVLLAGPAIRALAAGSDHLTLWCGPRGRRAAEMLPGVDEVIVRVAEWIDPEPPAVDWPSTNEFVEHLRTVGAATAVVFTSFHQSPLPAALLLRAAGVRRIAAISEDYPGSLLDVRHRVDDDIHEVERALSLAAAAGFALPEDDDGRLRVTNVGDVPAPLAGIADYIVVHPGASVPARAWEPEHSAALVDALAARGDTVVVTGGPEEVGLTSKVAGVGRDNVIDLGGRTTFPQLAAVIAGADAIVVGNTGPAHLAAAVQTPVVSLYAPTVPEARWRPYRVACELLYQPVPCAGCRARECPVPGHPCLALVTPEDVIAAIERLTSRRAAA